MDTGFAISAQSISKAGDHQEGVVLLHGLSRSAASMGKMARWLTDSGFVVVNQKYQSRRGSIAELSEQAIGQALNDSRLAECPRIHFVTHSLGGVLVRSYCARHPDVKIGRVVMLGPPNQGSEVVDRLGKWWLFRKILGPAGIELGTAPDSTPNRLGPVKFELGVIAGESSLNWINSLMITGTDDGKVSIERTRVAGMKDHVVVPVMHPFLMKRRRVMELTVRFLNCGSFADETDGW
ncbi:MAG: lipase family alpha/beta hydrolase [Limisphaerales bacterium]